MKLTNAALRHRLKKPGWYGEGDGLYFRVEDGEKAYWVYRYTGADGKRRRLSLGPFPELGPNEARAKHAELRARVVANKADPLAEKRAGKQARAGTPTFGEVADEHLAAHQSTRKNEGHRRQWFVALTRYCAPIRDMPVDEIDTDAVLRVLQPHWTRAPDTASRLRGMIERVLDAASTTLAD
jgi:hypothetical protein